MVNNYNTSISKRATDLLNVRDGTFFDNNLGNKIIPVIDINKPIVNVVVSASTATTGTATAYTTPTDKDFYLTGAVLSFQADATADNTSVFFTATINGVGTPIVNFRKLTTTATTQAIPITFSEPIKIDRNTNITYTSAFTVGACARSINLYGYISDTLQY